jgi:hypothetical protein
MRMDDHDENFHSQPAASAGGGGGMGPEAPFGLPVLAEVPELSSLLESLREVDRQIARAIEGLIVLQDTGLAESATGVALGQWIATIGRRTGADRRMLTTAAATCRRLPALREALGAGQISWCQLRAIACKVHRIPREHDARIEAEITGILAEVAHDTDPDGLARTVDWALRDLLADPDPTSSGAPERDFLAMQPRLDGSGGTIFGDFGPQGFAQLDACLNAGLHPDGRVKTRLGADTHPDAGEQMGVSLGRARARRLLGLCAAAGASPTPGAGASPTPGAGASPTPGAGASTAGGHRRNADPSGAATRLLARVDLSTLLGGDLPAQLLTHLTGGALRVDAATARALADRYGAHLRLIIHDHGRVVGVGRRTRRPPGWLRDAVLAMHDTCSAPGCRAAARVCDLDHARPWEHGGPTDLDNLAPMCATDNHDKEPEGWRCRQHPDGTRRWHHPRSGLTTHTHPATWQAPTRTTGADPPGREAGGQAQRAAGGLPNGADGGQAHDASNGADDAAARGDPDDDLPF